MAPSQLCYKWNLEVTIRARERYMPGAALLALVAGWPLAAEAQLSWAGPDIDRAAGDGRLCFEADHTKVLTALPYKGRGLAGEVVKACDVKLQSGLPEGVKLVLVARKPPGRVVIPVDEGGEVGVSRFADPEHRWQKRARRLLRRSGLTLVLQHGRKRVVVARYRRGSIQYFRTTLLYDPAGGGVTVWTYIFFGNGLTVGPAQLQVAIYSTKKRRGRRVIRRFNKMDCSNYKRCSSPRELKPFSGKPGKK